MPLFESRELFKVRQMLLETFEHVGIAIHGSDLHCWGEKITVAGRAMSF
jgi:hypothetical protein